MFCYKRQNHEKLRSLLSIIYCTTLQLNCKYYDFINHKMIVGKIYLKALFFFFFTRLSILLKQPFHTMGLEPLSILFLTYMKKITTQDEYTSNCQNQGSPNYISCTNFDLSTKCSELKN